MGNRHQPALAVPHCKWCRQLIRYEWSDKTWRHNDRNITGYCYGDLPREMRKAENRLTVVPLEKEWTNA